MNDLSGLQAIVDKNEVVSTRRARDLLERPEEVDNAYTFHLETYVPVHVGIAGDTRSGVEGFAKGFVKRIQEQRSPRGYITGEFGYGKTSTGLYVWKKASSENIIALPPFQLNKLTDFIDATYGWVQYQLGLVSPSHQEQAHQIYQSYTQRSLEDTAKRYNTDIYTIQEMVTDGRLNLDLTSDDILLFFRDMTNLVREAGFDGLLLIADEIQQYLDPEIRAGVPDPIGPLFDIVQGLSDEQQELAFGFLLVMPTMQLNVINDQRGDLIDRMRNFTLDLKTVYDREFPLRLWSRLSDIFGFREVAYQVITEDALHSLGQIATRLDLSNGPRTVVNLLRLAANRYVKADGDEPPYTPIDTIQAFVSGDVKFDGTKKIQEVVNRALDYDFVRRDNNLRQAVKLAAAFPQEGASEEVQSRFGLTDAFQELKASGYGEIVIEVSGRMSPGITLRGLDDVPIETDELALIMRDFGRNYIVKADLTRERALQGFVSVLQSNIFRDSEWKILNISQPDMFQSWEIVFEGAFSQMSRRYPQRMIHIVVSMDDQVQENQYDGEVSLNFNLQRYPDSELRAGTIHTDYQNHGAEFILNLRLPASEQVTNQLQDQLTKIINVAQITPLMLLTLHGYLEDLLERGQTSKRVQQLIESSIYRQIAQSVVKVLFNTQLGMNFDANGRQIVEEVTQSLIEVRYSDDYHTLITYQRWRDVLRTYIGGIKKLPAASQKRGLTPLTGTKSEIARHFDESISSFSNKLSRMPDIIDIEGGSLSTGDDNKLYFKLHPLETEIVKALKQSSSTVTIDDQMLHALATSDVYTWSAEIGYRPEEVKHVLMMLEARDLVLRHDDQIIEAPQIDVSIDDLRHEITDFQIKAQHVAEAFPQPDTEHYLQKSNEYRNTLSELDAIDEDDLLRLHEALMASQTALHSTVETLLGRIDERLNQAKAQLPELDPVQIESLQEPIRGFGYAHALNSIRLQILEEYRELHHQIDTQKEKIAESSPVTQETIAFSRYVRRVDGVTNRIDTIQSSWEELRRYMQRLKAWIKFVDDHVHLSDQLSQMGKSGVDLREELQQLEEKIHTQLEPGDFEALEILPELSNRLESISRAARKRRSTAENQFNEEENRYRQALIKEGRLKRNELWDKLPFNPEQPDTFYDRLYKRVREHIADILDSISEEIQRRKNELTMLKNNQHLQDTGNTQAILSWQQQLEDLKDDLSEPYALNTEDGVQDYEGGFNRILTTISNAYDRLYVIQHKIDDLRKSTQPPSRSVNAEILHGILEEIDLERIDLVELHERVRRSSLNITENEFWDALRELWEQQRFRITISD